MWDLFIFFLPNMGGNSRENGLKTHFQNYLNFFYDPQQPPTQCLLLIHREDTRNRAALPSTLTGSAPSTVCRSSVIIAKDNSIVHICLCRFFILAIGVLILGCWLWLLLLSPFLIRCYGLTSQSVEDLVLDNGIKHNLILSKLSQKQYSVGLAKTTIQHKCSVYLLNNTIVDDMIHLKIIFLF